MSRYIVISTIYGWKLDLIIIEKGQTAEIKIDANSPVLGTTKYWLEYPTYDICLGIYKSETTSRHLELVNAF